MKISITNHDETNAASLIHRRAGMRVGTFLIEPGETKRLEIERPDEAFTVSRSAAAAAPVAKTPAPAVPPVVAKPAEPAPPKKASWFEIRAKAIALGAPANVSKADAEKLVAEKATT